MKVVVKEPGKAPETREIDGDLDSMQAVIAHGRYSMIEHVQDGPPGLDLWANEEGKYAQNEKGEYLEANLSIFGGQDYVMGTVFVAKVDDEGESLGLEPMEIDIATEWLKQNAVGIIGAARARAFAAQFR